MAINLHSHLGMLPDTDLRVESKLVIPTMTFGEPNFAEFLYIVRWLGSAHGDFVAVQGPTCWYQHFPHRG